MENILCCVNSQDALEQRVWPLVYAKRQHIAVVGREVHSCGRNVAEPYAVLNAWVSFRAKSRCPKLLEIKASERKR